MSSLLNVLPGLLDWQLATCHINTHCQLHDQDEEIFDLNGSERITAILQQLPPDADIPTLRKALLLAQQALTEINANLCQVKKELFTLMASLSSKKRKAVLDKLDSVNESVGRVAKKFSILYRLWVIHGLFPIENNPGIDLSATTCWASPEVKHNAIVTELFMIMPETLTKEIRTYKSFGSVFIQHP
ncbi:hypothetical protein HD554DRAFT_2172510 [Boletus coccyginus]|nr:hypothetical protein HD554DRAFT_2172510 [Boletus coccyginus]